MFNSCYYSIQGNYICSRNNLEEGFTQKCQIKDENDKLIQCDKINIDDYDDNLYLDHIYDCMMCKFKNSSKNFIEQECKEIHGDNDDDVNKCINNKFSVVKKNIQNTSNDVRSFINNQKPITIKNSCKDTDYCTDEQINDKIEQLKEYCNDNPDYEDCECLIKDPNLSNDENEKALTTCICRLNKNDCLQQIIKEKIVYEQKELGFTDVAVDDITDTQMDEYLADKESLREELLAVDCREENQCKDIRRECVITQISKDDAFDKNNITDEMIDEYLKNNQDNEEIDECYNNKCNSEIRSCLNEYNKKQTEGCCGWTYKTTGDLYCKPYENNERPLQIDITNYDIRELNPQREEIINKLR